jgi:phage terminase large subunit-like protein
MKPSRRSDRVIAFIETYCPVPQGVLVGQPMKLLPFQKKFIRAIYDNPKGTRRAYLSIARKNGKTALIAALVLVHLVGPEAKLNAQIVSCGMSRDQASIVFKLASDMVQLSPDLSDVVRVVQSRKEMFGITMQTVYRALATKADTAHGLSPVLAILDEVGQVTGPKSGFIDSIVTAQGSHEAPLLIAISTQAANDGDLFSIWLDDAKRTDDPRIVSHVYTADKSADLDDQTAWKAANPALGVFRSIEDVKLNADEAKRMPSCENRFRQLFLNQRVSLVSPFMSPSVWESCADPASDLEGAKVFGGLDLSARADLTALVLIAKIDGLWHVQPHFWTPEQDLAERAKRDRQPYDVWRKQGFLRTTPGATVDYEYVARDIAEIAADLNVAAIAYDRWRVDLVKKEFAALGVSLPLVPHGQGFKDISPALETLEAEFLNARVRHGGHPVLTMCAAGAVVSKDPAGNRKLDKSKATARIDGMVALAMAFGAVSKVEEETPRQFQCFFL